MKPFRCPVCNGTGLVPGGFYQSCIGGAGTSSVSSEPCKQCNGTGIIWGQDDGTCNTAEARQTIETIPAVVSKEKAIELQVTDTLSSFGIPRHVKGFGYLREAIILSAGNRLCIDNITKVLYPTIADKYGDTRSRVERAMRHAIEIGCSKGSEEMKVYFNRPMDVLSDKPTNGEFIATIADNIRLGRRA